MKYKASFRPQKTRHDGNVYCVPPLGETDWDATEWVDGLCENERNEAFKPDTFSSDRLSADPNAPEWIREWAGPFYIALDEVTDEEMQKYQEFRLSVASHGQECPLCHNGTVESVRIGDGPGDFTTEIRCRGECGSVATVCGTEECPGCIKCGPPIAVKADEGCGGLSPKPTIDPALTDILRHSPSRETADHPLAGVAATMLGGVEFSVADMLTVRNLDAAQSCWLSFGDYYRYENNRRSNGRHDADAVGIARVA